MLALPATPNDSHACALSFWPSIARGSLPQPRATDLFKPRGENIYTLVLFAGKLHGTQANWVAAREIYLYFLTARFLAAGVYRRVMVYEKNLKNESLRAAR